MELEAIAIVGPTASGKTRRAVSIARMYDGEIISADSRQLYIGMTIGTGKDLEEYGEIPYHLIDIVPAGTRYNLYRYLRDFNDAMVSIKNRGHIPVICGGTGMYIENALNGIKMPEVPHNPELREYLSHKDMNELIAILQSYKQLHNKTDIDSSSRAIRAIEIEEYYLHNPEYAASTKKEKALPVKSLVIGIDIPREARRRRITERLQSRLKEGMIDEVKRLLDSGILPEDLIYYGLEYKFLTLYILGKLSYDDMVNKLEIAIHQFAKRQMTWFRGMEKRGTKINWLPWDIPDSEFNDKVRKLMSL